MAVTSMWAVKSRLDHVIDYVEDKDKTISKVIDYAIQDGKTNDQYISCINCYYDNPYGHMMKTKELFNDHKQRLAYHGYQSFKPGEGTPDMIHEIGVKTARELFGDKFEVVVTTHLDKKYYHNHFIVNATSFVDGKRFCNTKHDRYLMRTVSDRLCKEYGLSVIENPEYGKRNKNNYQATQSFIKEIKHDFDLIIKKSFLTKQVYDAMKMEGYIFEMVNEMECIRHPRYDKPIQITMLGERYNYDSINSRVLKDGSKYNTYYSGSKYNVQNEPYIFQLYKQKKLTGIQYTYVKWAILIGIMPQHHLKPRKHSKETLEALKKLDMYSNSVNLMFKYDIHSLDDIAQHQSKAQVELNVLLKERQRCYYKRSKCINPIEMSNWSTKATAYTPKIKQLRKEIKTCNFIKDRTLSYERQNQELEQNIVK